MNLQKNTIKICERCKKEYDFEALKQPGKILNFNRRKYCSSRCRSNAGAIMYNRRQGMLPKGSPEWLKRITNTTKDAMQKPEVQAKLHAPRGPLTQAHRIKIAEKLAGRMPSNMMYGNSAYPNVQRGDYETSKGTIYFRSKWEANYALYLDFLIKQKQIKDWEFESEKFIFDKIQFGTRSYMPDFKITNNNGSFEYHEVKGYFDSRSKTKLKRMAKYYPHIKIILIEKESYMDIKKKVGKMLHFY